MKNLPQKIEAALIDMDGVLYDSMRFHAKAWHQMMKLQGIDTCPDEYFLYEGMTGAATIDLIIRRELHRPATDEEKTGLYKIKSEIFASFGKKPVMHFAQSMTRAIHDAGIPTVLVTGSGQSTLLNSLDTDYPGIFPHDMRVTAKDVEHGKPSPEPYLTGARKAGADPKNCIVIENAPLGVRAGKAAGCFTIAVTTGPIPREAFEKEGADMIFANMEEFSNWLHNTLLH